MAENSKIEWCDHTFNPWIGCTKISPACDHCYAETLNNRFGGGNWGAKAPRRRTVESNWNKPLKWNKGAEKKGIRYKVFCASMADVFDNAVPKEWRADLWDLIKATPNLDWLILTKRPQNITKMLPNDWGFSGYDNVWLGTTIENQKVANQNLPIFLDIPAKIHFLSCEPLLEEINLIDFLPFLDWIIVGGESGKGARPMNPEWVRSIRYDCSHTKTPFLFKQWGGENKKATGRKLDGKTYTEFPINI